MTILSSKLYHIEPRGMSTGLIESIRSYIIRISAELCVPPNSFILEFLSPPFSTNYNTRDLSIYGQDETVQDIVNTLEVLTCRRDLTNLTLLPLMGQVSTTRLFRKSRAWCPMCIEEWSIRKEVVYEPLIWSLADIEVCPRHQIVLQSVCATCSRVNKSLQPIGVCPYCGAYQGSAWQRDLQTATSSQLLRTKAVVDFIKNLMYYRTRLNHQNIRGFIGICADRIAHGDLQLLANECGLHGQHTKEYCLGERIPSLNTLIRLSIQTGIPLTMLYFCDGRDFIVDQMHIKSLHKLDGYKNRRTKSSWLERQADLPRAAALYIRSHQGRTTLYALSSHLNCSIGWLRRNISRPLLQQLQTGKHIGGRITGKYEYVLKALQSALENDPPISLMDVCRTVGLSRDTLKYHFPDLYERIIRRHEQHIIQQRVEWHKTLNHALSETPPPSLEEISRRLGISSAVLRVRYRELTNQICANYSEYRKAMKKPLHRSDME